MNALGNTFSFLKYQIPEDTAIADSSFDICDSVGIICASLKIPGYYLWHDPTELY